MKVVSNRLQGFLKYRSLKKEFAKIEGSSTITTDSSTKEIRKVGEKVIIKTNETGKDTLTPFLAQAVREKEPVWKKVGYECFKEIDFKGKKVNAYIKIEKTLCLNQLFKNGYIDDLNAYKYDLTIITPSGDWQEIHDFYPVSYAGSHYEEDKFNELKSDFEKMAELEDQREF